MTPQIHHRSTMDPESGIPTQISLSRPVLTKGFVAVLYTILGTLLFILLMTENVGKILSILAKPNNTAIDILLQNATVFLDQNAPRVISVISQNSDQLG